ncbi:uncharacterized protein VTP21DRAFT_7117 [Calcarisporiella thermophila]|uniref:uncharacterized protein n=1 Tax=Calcarisporiella thermophila TaxID=911321 RepID=UPI0037442A21
MQQTHVALPSIRTLLAEPVPGPRASGLHQRHVSSPFSSFPDRDPHAPRRGHMRSGSDGFAPSFTFPPREPSQVPSPSAAPASQQSPMFSPHIGKLTHALAHTKLGDPPENPLGTMEPDLAKMRGVEVFNRDLTLPALPQTGPARGWPPAQNNGFPHANSPSRLADPKHSTSSYHLSPPNAFPPSSPLEKARLRPHSHHRSVSDLTHPYSPHRELAPLHALNPAPPASSASSASDGPLPPRLHHPHQHRRAASHTSIDSLINRESGAERILPPLPVPPALQETSGSPGPKPSSQAPSASPAHSPPRAPSSTSPLATSPALTPAANPPPPPSHGSQNRYQCPYCPKRFSRPSSLKIHTYSHTGERPFVCSVEGCGRSFSVQSNLRRHMRVHRTGRLKKE